MDDIRIIKTPKYIVYNGNLYELMDTDIPLVLDYDEAVNLAKQEAE